MTRGSYIGGHTVLRQSADDFDAELARKANRHKRRLLAEQAQYDAERAAIKQQTEAKIAKADNEMRRPWHRGRP